MQKCKSALKKSEYCTKHALIHVISVRYGLLYKHCEDSALHLDLKGKTCSIHLGLMICHFQGDRMARRFINSEPSMVMLA